MAGALTAVAVPSAHVRGGPGPGAGARADPVDLMRCRHRLSKLLLRHGRVWDRSAWTQGAPRSGSAAQTLRASQHRAGVHRQPRRRATGSDAQTGARRAALARRDRPGVLAARLAGLRAFRGIDTLSALIIVLEVADFTRFPRAVQLGSWLGLVPSREQSGETRRARVDHQDRLEVRPADPGRGRMALRPPTSIGRTLYERQEGLPDHVLQIATRAQQPPVPRPQADAGAQEARQRDRRRVRTRARLLPLGRRHCSITQTDSPLPLGWGGAGPRSPLARAERAMGSPHQATPAPRHASASDETRDLG